MIREKSFFEKSIPERTANFSDFPKELKKELCEFLESQNINQLYCHQVEMFEQVEKGNNVVITTSTASGKTLSFLLPVINRILSNPLSRSIFIYPTKALASDQYRALKPFLDYFGQSKIISGVYDGDTPINERSKLRSSANIILTNPEMINSAFLPNHSNYNNNFIFSNLEFVVIDELHSYKGAFGAHMSNIFKRLHRICNYYNSKPQFLCSSATIANPVELANNICSKDFVLIDNDGSPSPEKKYVFIQPPFYSKSTTIVPIVQIATQIIPELVVDGNHFIAFCKSRKAVEVILKESREKLKYDGVNNKIYENKIAGYRGGYTPAERKEIENKMVSGELFGLVSTNALELGIDIGKVDTTILVGYPKTRASFWQQAGRAGRKGKVSTTYLILDDLPLDQFVAVNPNWLFNSSSENAIIDKENIYIQLAHLRAAAAELPISLDDSILFSRLSEIVPTLIKAGELRKENGKYVWSGGAFPAGDYSLRNMDIERYQMIDEGNNSSITEVDELIAFRDCHDKSIYMHDGRMYCVRKLDLETKKIFVNELEVNYYTEPLTIQRVRIINDIKQDKIKECLYNFGDINVTKIYGSHKKIQFNNRNNLGFESDEKHLEKEFDTESIWINIPENIINLFNKIIPLNNEGGKKYYTYFDGMTFALKNSSMMITMASSEDISSDSEFSFPDDEEQQRKAKIFIYDNYKGGLGYSKKMYNCIEEIINNAIKMVDGCKCKDGCVICVGDHQLDKKIVSWGLHSLIEKTGDLISNKQYIDSDRKIEKKPFLFNDLKDKWSDFVNMLLEKNEYMAHFLNEVTNIKIRDNTIILIVKDSFTKNWVDDETNNIQLNHIINFYVESSNLIEIESEIIKQ